MTDPSKMPARTPGPWFVRDFRASEMQRLGWIGPSIDRILIVNNADPRDETGCVIARIQFDNRPERLGENNLADAQFIVEACNQHDELKRRTDIAEQLAEALDSIRQYGSDTLSGRADGGPNDRDWQRDAVREMTRRASAAITAWEASNG